MTQNRRKRGFNDGTEDRSVAPYFQWKLKYGAIARRHKLHIPCFRAQRESKLIPLRLLSKSKPVL